MIPMAGQRQTVNFSHIFYTILHTRLFCTTLFVSYCAEEWSGFNSLLYGVKPGKNFSLRNVD